MDTKKRTYENDDLRIDWLGYTKSRNIPVEVINVEMNLILKRDEDEDASQIEDEMWRHFKYQFKSRHFEDRKIVICDGHKDTYKKRNDMHISIELTLKLKEPRLWKDMGEIFSDMESYLENYARENILSKFKSVRKEYGDKRRKITEN